METNQILDLGPTTRAVARLVQGVSDTQLDAPTPCPAYSVGDVAEHIAGLTLAFTAAARKEGNYGGDGPPPPGDAARLEPGWRDRVVADLAELADAWQDPSAYEGQTQAGGVDMSGAEAGMVALNELVVHGWDLARASGQPYDVDDAAVSACVEFGELFSGPGTEEMRGDAFGPVVEVPTDATPLDRLVGLMGRDPNWAPR
jgi:uncharacterized protein (TIGR03086 family)